MVVVLVLLVLVLLVLIVHFLHLPHREQRRRLYKLMVVVLVVLVLVLLVLIVHFLQLPHIRCCLGRPQRLNALIVVVAAILLTDMLPYHAMRARHYSARFPKRSHTSMFIIILASFDVFITVERRTGRSSSPAVHRCGRADAPFLCRTCAFGSPLLHDHGAARAELLGAEVGAAGSRFVVASFT